jgi:hypothetical protein
MKTIHPQNPIVMKTTRRQNLIAAALKIFLRWPARAKPCCAIAAAAGFSGSLAFAQPALPTDALQQLQQVIGNPIEAVNILGGDYAASGGIYTFHGGNAADLSITKLGGGLVASPEPLGLGSLQWAPVL